MKLPRGMGPDLVSEWGRDGFMSPDSPTAEIIQASANEGRHLRLRGFVFNGPGWYPKHRVLVTATGETKGGKPTFELRFYAQDPRPALLALSQLPEQL